MPYFPISSRVSRVFPAAGLLLALALATCSSITLAANPNAPAEFVITSSKIADPKPYGTGCNLSERWNNLWYGGGMEACNIEQMWEVDGGGQDEKGDYILCDTRLWNSVSSGFLDGASVRIYREVSNEAGGEEKIILLRTDTVPEGGYIAAGWDRLGHPGSEVVAANTSMTDPYYIKNDGTTYFYSVIAVDASGNTSERSNFASATPEAGRSTGPKILTRQQEDGACHSDNLAANKIVDPRKNRDYSESTPLLRLRSVGGEPPLTWSLIDGTLPEGMALGTDGAISGTCADPSREYAFKVQVTDAGGKSDQRWLFFFQKPRKEKDETAPAPPTGLTVEAGDDYCALTWEPSPDSDVVAYRIERSRFHPDTHAQRIYLAGDGPDIQENDICLFQKRVANLNPDWANARIRRFWNNRTFQLAGNAVSNLYVAHPGTIPPAFAEEEPGELCAEITSATDGEFGISNGVPAQPAGKNLRFEAWIRSDNLASGSVRLRFAQGNSSSCDETIPFEADGVWRKIHADFTVADERGGAMAEVLFPGPGAVQIDNVAIYDLDNSEGVNGVTDSVQNALNEMIGKGVVGEKGTLRMCAIYTNGYNEHSMTTCMDNLINSHHLMMPSYNLKTGRHYNWDKPQTLPFIMKMLMNTGDSPETRMKPWLIMSPGGPSEEDWLHLIEYLAADYVSDEKTPYAAKRVKHRGGNTTPWAVEFEKIYFQWGNETWNQSLYFSYGAGYGSRDSAARVGHMARYFWEYMAENSPYWEANAEKFGLITGGWNNDWGVWEAQATHHTDMLADAKYIGGWDEGYLVGGGEISAKGWQDLLTWGYRVGQPAMEKHFAQRQTLIDEGLDLEPLGIYEFGPGYPHRYKSDKERDASETYGKSTAVALAQMDMLFHFSQNGGGYANFSSMDSRSRTFTSHTPVAEGFRPHTAWLALKMANLYGKGAMVATETKSAPTYNRGGTGSRKDRKSLINDNIPLASAYAYRHGDGENYTVFVLNRHADQPADGIENNGGYLPVTLRLPFTTAKSITLHRLWDIIDDEPAELIDSNREEMRVDIRSKTLDPAQFSQSFVINGVTGDDPRGIPPGTIYCYVFEGVATGAGVEK